LSAGSRQQLEIQTPNSLNHYDPTTNRNALSTGGSLQFTKHSVVLREAKPNANLHVYDSAAIGQRCDVDNDVERSFGERHDVKRHGSNRGHVLYTTARACRGDVVGSNNRAADSDRSSNDRYLRSLLDLVAE